MKRTFAILLIIILSVYSYFDAQYHKPPVSDSRLMMDTVITIKAYGDNTKKAIEAGFKVFSEIENEVSYHIASSTLSKLNKYKTIEKKGHFANIIELCKTYEEITNGYFDPTFSSITQLYGFYGDIPKELPSDNIIQNILNTKIGLNKMLSTASSSYALNENAQLDLGGATGGYALKLASYAMKSTGCDVFLIDDSGDIYVNGEKPDGSPWKIAVKSPYDNAQIATVEMKSGQTISTSGNYERFVKIQGKRYGHIMNPLTGKPADEFDSVTVLMNDPVAADIMSTALFAMPKQMAIDKSNQMQLAVLFITNNKNIILSEKGKSKFNMLINNF